MSATVFCAHSILLTRSGGWFANWTLERGLILILEDGRKRGQSFRGCGGRRPRPRRPTSIWASHTHSFVHSSERASSSLTSPLFHVPVCQMQRPVATKGEGEGERERERERPYDSAKQKCARAWERKMPEERWRERGREGAAGKPIKNYMPPNNAPAEEAAEQSRRLLTIPHTRTIRGRDGRTNAL